MSKSTRKTILALVLVIGLPVLFFKSCVIYNPKPDQCDVVTSKIVGLVEGPTFDILFKTDSGETYYINRGIESGLNIDELNNLALNKPATFHIVKLAFGSSNHIAKLTVKDTVLYSEF